MDASSLGASTLVAICHHLAHPPCLLALPPILGSYTIMYVVGCREQGVEVL